MFVFDETAAGEFDYVIAVDKSSSMLRKHRANDPNSKTRWAVAQELVFGLAVQTDKWDDNGIDLVYFGGDIIVKNGVHADVVDDLFSTITPNGSTPTAEALTEVVKMHNAQGKNMVCIVLTDGEPNDQNAVVQVIKAAANKLDRDEQLTFLIIQVGDDPDATKFLNFIDNNLNAKFDIVCVLKPEEADKMDAIALINHAINS